MQLAEFFIEYPDVAIAFSGGVDSSFLLWAAKKYAHRVTAYYVKSSFQPQFELDDAKRLAGDLDVDMKQLEVDILSNSQVSANPSNRCYYCKRVIFETILNEARKDGFSTLLDGSNASDDAGDRPGMVALKELSVLSPLRMCELTKSDIRSLSKQAGLFTWNKPSYACLATRIPTGTEITPALLERTEKAEDYLSSLGFSDFRIRTLNDSAKLQLVPSQLGLLIDKRQQIVAKLREDYSSVLLDLETRDEQ